MNLYNMDDRVSILDTNKTATVIKVVDGGEEGWVYGLRHDQINPEHTWAEFDPEEGLPEGWIDDVYLHENKITKLK